MDIVSPSRIAATRSHSRLLALSLASALLCACQSRPPKPTPERAISAALSVDASLSLRTQGDALNDTESVGAQLSLADALARSVRNSTELQASLARVRIALADAEQARLLPNPLLDVIVRVPDGGGRANIEAGASADLLSLLQRPRKSDAADERLRMAVADAVSTSLTVAAHVQERYATVQALDELSPLLRERREGLAKLIALSRSRLNFGEASKLDVTTLEAQAVELDLEIAERESERREERLALARAIGRPSDGATWTLEDWAALPELTGDEVQWLEAGLRHRPEVLARTWALAALGDDGALVGLSVLEGSAFGVNAQRDGAWSIGPTATVPLPLFDAGNARRDRAEAAIVEARHELVGVQRAIVEEVRRAHAAYIAAKASLQRVRTELIPLQRERREQIEAIYLAGQADLTAVLLAEQDLRAAQEKLVELEKKTAVSLVRLERAVGGAGVAKQIGRSQSPAREGRDYVQEELE